MCYHIYVMRLFQNPTAFFLRSFFQDHHHVPKLKNTGILIYPSSFKALRINSHHCPQQYLLGASPFLQAGLQSKLKTLIWILDAACSLSLFLCAIPQAPAVHPWPACQVRFFAVTNLTQESRFLTVLGFFLHPLYIRDDIITQAYVET